jgi:hypothetical protein
MASQIPAGQISSAREQRVHTSLRLRRIEKKFRLAIFLLYGVVTGDGDLSEGKVRRHSIAEDGKIDGVGNDGKCDQRQKRNHQQPFQEGDDTRALSRGHARNYSRRPRPRTHGGGNRLLW